MHGSLRDACHRMLYRYIVREVVLVSLEMFDSLENLAAGQHWNTQGLEGLHRCVSQAIPLRSAVTVRKSSVTVDIPYFACPGACENRPSEERHCPRESDNSLKLATKNLVVIILLLWAVLLS